MSLSENTFPSYRGIISYYRAQVLGGRGAALWFVGAEELGPV